jgi:cell division transport system permease protein
MTRDFLSSHDEQRIPSNTLAYFFREAVRRIWVSKRSSFVAIGMIAISLLIVGSFLLIAENLGRAVTRAQGRSRVSVYLNDTATPAQIAVIDAWLASHPDLRHRRFVSKQEALRRFSSYFTKMNDLMGQLDGNPFPPSFDCDVPATVVQSPAFIREVAALRAIPGVDDVQFDWEWARRLERVVQTVNIAGLVAGGILALAAAFTIANVIRLTMMLYREEIDIMRLVGASERIIRGPFLMEGLLQGILGSAVAVGLLFGGFEAARHFLPPANSLIWSFLFSGFLSWQKIAALAAGGTIAGFLGSWFSVRATGEEVA